MLTFHGTRILAEYLNKCHPNWVHLPKSDDQRKVVYICDISIKKNFPFHNHWKLLSNAIQCRKSVLERKSTIDI